jgi:hypothetical protein
MGSRWPIQRVTTPGRRKLIWLSGEILIIGKLIWPSAYVEKERLVWPSGEILISGKLIGLQFTWKRKG